MSDCRNCGEHARTEPCEWAMTCATCDGPTDGFAELLCEDCDDHNKRVAAAQRRADLVEGRGDYMRDMRKDSRSA